MKIVKFLMIGVLITGASSLSSCKKQTKKEIEEQIKNHEASNPHGSVKSQEITVYSYDWQGDGDGYNAVKSASILTSDIVNKGAVMCYLKDGNSYIAMPITMSQGSWIEHYLFSYSTNTINFLIYDDDGQTYSPGTQTFKVVAIESSALMENPNVDLKNYEQVKKAFNIIE